MIVHAKQILADDTLAKVVVKCEACAPGVVLSIPLADRGEPVQVMVEWGVVHMMMSVATAEFAPALAAWIAQQ